MATFKRYQSLKRFGTQETQDIEVGKVYIFPKLDGTNASAWFEDGEIQAGSRNRLLAPNHDGIESDNAGFAAWAKQDDKLKSFFQEHPNLRLYGEWLVPHTIKHYRSEAWRQFYVFDVVNDDTDEFIPYETYELLLDKHGLSYIPPMATAINPTIDQLLHVMSKNTFLMLDGAGIGEGIVVKNYGYVNRYGRTVWAKLVSNEFKEKNAKEFGIQNVTRQQTVEEEIIEEFATQAFFEKEYAKLKLQKGGWESQYIKELIGRTWYEFLAEESVNFIQKHKNPTINFKVLNNLFLLKMKVVLKGEVF